MKRRMCVGVLILLITVFAGCNHLLDAESTMPLVTSTLAVAETLAQTDSYQKIEYHTFYELYEIKNENDEVVKYQYSILRPQGDVLDTQEWTGGEPQITKIGAFLVEVVLLDGTLPAIHRYYDVLSEKKSQDFEVVYAVDTNEELVAYFSSAENDIYDVTLIVCDMFEPKNRKIEIKREFVSLFRPADNVQFLLNGKLYLEYDVFAVGNVEVMISGGTYEFKKVEEIIDISGIY